ncbi:hypothetical protein EDB19DRAFT_1831697 [Suillus lakei]|nr:hypothetical protein EDB19DRAFT_1832333 [Suillus lakei]KAG1731590.1 hypothetical protein EDB19DRAFT_1831697 [Suillus lakei]
MYPFKEDVPNAASSLILLTQTRLCSLKLLHSINQRQKRLPEQQQKTSKSTTMAIKQEKGKGKQRDEPPADAHTPLPNDPTSPERNLRKRPMHALEPSSSRIAPEMKQPKVVEVSAVRAFQRIIVWTPKPKTRDVPVTALVDGSSQPGSSSHVGPAGVGASLQLVSGQPGPAMVGNGAGHPSSYPPPSHFVNHTSRDSDSIEIQGSCNKFLDKICYPCGHYY